MCALFFFGGGGGNRNFGEAPPTLKGLQETLILFKEVPRIPLRCDYNKKKLSVDM